MEELVIKTFIVLVLMFGMQEVEVEQRMVPPMWPIMVREVLVLEVTAAHKEQGEEMQLLVLPILVLVVVETKDFLVLRQVVVQE
jgi:hypothetical protein